MITNQFVGQMVEQNPFTPSEDATLSAPAPTEGDHEVCAALVTSRSKLTTMGSVSAALFASSLEIGARPYVRQAAELCGSLMYWCRAEESGALPINPCFLPFALILRT